MVFALCACGTAEKTEEQKAQLAEILQMLDTAYSNYKSASTTILNEWTTTQSAFVMYFDKSEYDALANYKKNNRYSERGKMWEHYEIADGLKQEALNSVKTISPTDDTRDYYNAIKTYYSSIDAFRTLIQTWPAGYTELTFSQAVSSAKNDCDKAASDLAFY